MSFLDTLQQRVGFTRREAVAILTLSTTFLIGTGIRWFQSKQKPDVQTQQQFDYSRLDSTYANRLQNSNQQATPIGTSPSSPEATQRRPTKQPAIVNINIATKSQLMRLPGIGESYAQRILEYKTTHGKFNSIDELSGVKGIGKKKLEQLRPYVRVK